MYIRYKIHLKVISWKIAIFRFRLAPKKDLHFSSLSPKISVINSMPLSILFKCFLLLFEPKVLIFWLFSFLLGHGTAHTSHVALRGVLHNILYTVKPFEILRSRKTILFIFLRPTIRHCSSVFFIKSSYRSDNEFRTFCRSRKSPWHFFRSVKWLICLWLHSPLMMLEWPDFVQWVNSTQ